MGWFRRYKQLTQKAYFSCLKDEFSRADYLRKHGILKNIGDPDRHYAVRNELRGKNPPPIV